MRFTSILCAFLCTISLAKADDAVLNAWLKKQPTILSLDTTFTQERKLPALKNPTSTPGRLTFKKPGQFRWQLGEPPETLAISDGTTLTLIQTKEKTARQFPATSPQAARFSLLSGKAFGSIEDFNQTFEVIEWRIVSGIHQYTLKPKDRRMRNQVPWIFLDIEPLQNTLTAMEMELQDKSRIRSIFKNPQINKPVEANLFKPDLSGLSVK